MVLLNDSSWSPLARANDVLQNNVIQQIPKNDYKSISQVILRWHYQLDAISIPKLASPDSLENILIFDFSLTPSDRIFDRFYQNGPLLTNETLNPKLSSKYFFIH